MTDIDKSVGELPDCIKTEDPSVSYELLFELAKVSGLVGAYSTKEVNDRIVGFARVVLGNKAVQEAFVRANRDCLSRAALQPAHAPAGEPVAYRYEFNSPLGSGTVWRYSAEPWNGQHPISVQALYTAQPDQSARIEELEAEVKRLNEWADGFTDIHLRERQTGDALVKELLKERDELRRQLAEAQAKNAELVRYFFSVEAEIGSHLPASALEALSLAKRVSDTSALTAAIEQAKAEARKEERERLARRFEKMADAFSTEHGQIDPDTETLEFGRGAHAEYLLEHHSFLCEQAETIRALSAAIAAAVEPYKADAERYLHLREIATAPAGDDRWDLFLGGRSPIGAPHAEFDRAVDSSRAASEACSPLQERR